MVVPPPKIVDDPRQLIFKKNINKRHLLFHNMIVDLVAIFKPTGLESPKEVRALDRITHFLKFISNFMPTDELRKLVDWKLEDHKGCCEVDEHHHNIFDLIKAKVMERKKKVDECDKLEFLDYYEMLSDLKKWLDLAEHTITQHQYNKEFNRFVAQGRDIVAFIKELDKQLEEKIEPKVEMKVEEKVQGEVQATKHTSE